MKTRIQLALLVSLAGCSAGDFSGTKRVQVQWSRLGAPEESWVVTAGESQLEPILQLLQGLLGKPSQDTEGLGMAATGIIIIERQGGKEELTLYEEYVRYRGNHHRVTRQEWAQLDKLLQKAH